MATESMGDERGWDGFSARRSRLRLPLRPDAAVAERCAGLIGDRAGNVLMLGMTAELAGIGEALTIVDWNRAMLVEAAGLNRPNVTTLREDWRDMRFSGASFSAAIGDGSLSTLCWPLDYRRVLDRLAGTMAPGGKLVLRCFVAPDQPETLSAIREAVLTGAEPSFHALKWRIAMALAAEGEGNVPVRDILAGFEACFPHREALAQASGWTLDTIAEIDAYRGSAVAYSFVPQGALLAVCSESFDGAHLVASGSYPLSDRCPFLVAGRGG